MLSATTASWVRPRHTTGSSIVPITRTTIGTERSFSATANSCSSSTSLIAACQLPCAALRPARCSDACKAATNGPRAHPRRGDPLAAWLPITHSVGRRPPSVDREWLRPSGRGRSVCSCSRTEQHFFRGRRSQSVGPSGPTESAQRATSRATSRDSPPPLPPVPPPQGDEHGRPQERGPESVLLQQCTLTPRSTSPVGQFE